MQTNAALLTHTLHTAEWDFLIKAFSSLIVLFYRLFPFSACCRSCSHGGLRGTDLLWLRPSKHRPGFLPVWEARRLSDQCRSFSLLECRSYQHVLSRRQTEGCLDSAEVDGQAVTKPQSSFTRPPLGGCHSNIEEEQQRPPSDPGWPSWVCVRGSGPPVADKMEQISICVFHLINVSCAWLLWLYLLFHTLISKNVNEYHSLWTLGAANSKSREQKWSLVWKHLKPGRAGDIFKDF